MSHLGSALFSGLRGGTFMCTLMRLNRRLKHLLFHSLLRQEVHFFQTTNTGRLAGRKAAPVALHWDAQKSEVDSRRPPHYSLLLFISQAVFLLACTPTWT